MTYYPRSAYGSANPNSGKPANGDTYAWGGYQWQNCPPSSLNGTTNYVTKFGQRLQVTVRKEIVELLTLMFQIADMYDYCVWAYKDGEAWGPWGASCRAVSGTTTPSGHSKNLSVDINAPYNPYSYTFQSDMPPDMVKAIESCGWYWGGRYEGQKYDAMHYGYCWTPADVAGHVDKARSILGGYEPGTPEPEPPKIKTLTEVGMFITFGPGGARLCGPGYTKNLEGEEYDALVKVPGMQVLSVDQREWDVIGAACAQGEPVDVLGARVWMTQVPSRMNPGTTIEAQDMLGYIDEHTQVGAD